MFVTRICFHLQRLHCLWAAISFIQNARTFFATHIDIILHSAPRNNYYVLFIYLQRIVNSCIFKMNTKNRNVINFCYDRKMPNVTKKNLIIIKSIIAWKWNHLSFHKKFFSEKKYKLFLCIYAREFHVIYGPMVGENRYLLTSTETPA